MLDGVYRKSVEGNRPEYSIVNRGKAAVLEAVARLLRPSREATDALRQSYDRVLHALPPDDLHRVMERARGPWQKAAGIVGAGALVVDIGVPVLFAARSQSVWSSRGTQEGARIALNDAITVAGSIPKGRARLESILTKDGIDTLEQIAQEKHRQAGVRAGKWAGGAIAWGVGRPAERAVTLTARGAGALGERVARRMREMRNLGLDKPTTKISH